MLIVNKLSTPGDIRRVELHADEVRVMFYDKTERVYRFFAAPHISFMSGNQCITDATNDEDTNDSEK